MRLRTPRVTRTYTLFPNTTLFRSWTDISATLDREDMAADTAMAGPELDGVRENLTVTVLEDRTLGAYENHAHADLSYLSRSEEHTSELQSLMRNSYAVSRLKKKHKHTHITPSHQHNTIMQSY